MAIDLSANARERKKKKKGTTAKESTASSRIDLSQVSRAYEERKARGERYVPESAPSTIDRNYVNKLALYTAGGAMSAEKT